jgi:predicted transcriptional regulator
MARDTQAKEGLRDFHVPLPEQVYQELKSEAESSRRSANAVAREAISQWLEARRQARLDHEVLVYAEAVAGTDADLDVELEAAGLELLRRNG